MYTILNDVISLLQTEPAVNVLKLFFNPNVAKLLPTEHVLQLIEKTRLGWYKKRESILYSTL